MKKNDIVNHPSHYTDGNIEVIDFIEDKQLGFCLGNAVKYISRAGKKYKDKEIEDLEKAIWYIKRRIKELKNGEQEKINERLEEMIEKEGLNRDLTPECPEVKIMPLGNSKKIADKVDKNSGLTEENIDTNKLKQTVDKETEEDKFWNVVYKAFHNVDPTYTREEFEKDLEKAKEISKIEMPTLMDFSRILK